MILIDNGHGYATRSQRSRIYPNGMQIYEGALNRAIVNKLIPLLPKQSIRLVSEDKDIPIKERVQRIKKSNAKLVISIHNNAHKDFDISGTEVWHYPGSQIGSILAQNVLQCIIETVGWNNRGIWTTKKWPILKRHLVPALLIECGFYTNYDQAKELIQSETQHKLAQAIATGIHETLRQI